MSANNEQSDQASEERLIRMFRLLDKNNDGLISVDEIKSVLRLSEAVGDVDKLASDLIREGDTNADYTMNMEEFFEFVSNRRRRLRVIFDRLDRNRDQQIDAKEIQTVMTELGFKVTLNEARNFLRKMDRDESCSIDFNEWSDFLLFSDSTDIKDIFLYWKRATSFDIGENGIVPDDFSEDEKRTKVAWKTLLSGGFAGAVSRTATAPLDRLKLIWQSQAGKYVSPKKRIGVIEGLRRMVAEGGLDSMWRGNGLNCLKIAPETAIKFLSYEHYKSLLVGSEQRCVTLGEKFCAGAMAGATAQTIIYPLEMLKTRMCLRKTGQYSSMFDCARSIYLDGGVKAFYRGYVPNILGVLPYAGIDLALFETFKKLWTQFCVTEQEVAMAQPNVFVSLTAGAFASVCGQVATYPLALVRTKMQVRKQGSPPVGLIGMFRFITKNEGFAGLYNGVGPNMLKVIPAVSISYAVFDQVRNLLNVKS